MREEGEGEGDSRGDENVHSYSMRAPDKEEDTVLDLPDLDETKYSAPLLSPSSPSSSGPGMKLNKASMMFTQLPDSVLDDDMDEHQLSPSSASPPHTPQEPHDPNTVYAPTGSKGLVNVPRSHPFSLHDPDEAEDTQKALGNTQWDVPHDDPEGQKYKQKNYDQTIESMRRGAATVCMNMLFSLTIAVITYGTAIRHRHAFSWQGLQAASAVGLAVSWILLAVSVKCVPLTWVMVVVMDVFLGLLLGSMSISVKSFVPVYILCIHSVNLILLTLLSVVHKHSTLNPNLSMLASLIITCISYGLWWGFQASTDTWPWYMGYFVLTMAIHAHTLGVIRSGCIKRGRRQDSRMVMYDMYTQVGFAIWRFITCDCLRRNNERLIDYDGRVIRQVAKRRCCCLWYFPCICYDRVTIMGDYVPMVSGEEQSNFRSEASSTLLTPMTQIP